MLMKTLISLFRKMLPASILFVCFIAIVASFGCTAAESYKYKITHKDGSIDTILIQDSSPVIFIKDGISCLGYANCSCDVYAVNVASFNKIGVMQPTKAEIDAAKENNRKLIILGLVAISTIIVWISLRSVDFTELIERIQKSKKTSKMKSILKFIIYSGIIILVFRIMIILIKYLPEMIESYLK